MRGVGSFTKTCTEFLQQVSVSLANSARKLAGPVLPTHHPERPRSVLVLGLVLVRDCERPVDTGGLEAQVVILEDNLATQEVLRVFGGLQAKCEMEF